VIWRRPGGIQEEALAFGPIGGDAYVISTGVRSPFDPSERISALRASGKTYAELIGARVLMVGGKTGDDASRVRDAISWLTRREQFAELAVLPTDVQAAHGSLPSDAYHAAGKKVLAQFGGDGPRLRGVVDEVNVDKCTGLATFAVRFFGDDAEERCFDASTTTAETAMECHAWNREKVITRSNKPPRVVVLRPGRFEGFWAQVQARRRAVAAGAAQPQPWKFMCGGRNLSVPSVAWRPTTMVA